MNRSAMKEDEESVARAITDSMVREVGPELIARDLELIGELVEVCVQFDHFLTGRGRWPAFPEDPFHNMKYEVSGLLCHVNTFLSLVQLYGILTGSKRSTVDWTTVTTVSVKDRYLFAYQEFIDETHFVKKLRLLLDLYKLQLVFAGMFYDCHI
jgi:hypothetical protein